MYDRPNITCVLLSAKYRLMLSAQLIPHYLSENERDVTSSYLSISICGLSVSAQQLEPLRPQDDFHSSFRHMIF